MEFSDIFRNEEETKPVYFPIEWFLKILTEFKALDERTGMINYYAVQELYLRLLELVGEERRIVVLDKGGSICLDGKRIEGLTSFQQSVIAYIAHYHRATADELLDAVWHKPDGKKKMVSNVIGMINEFFHEKRLPCQIGLESAGAYRFFFSSCEKPLK